MSTIDDKRNAVIIHAGIGSQVLAASFVLLGIILGYFDVRNIGIWSPRGILLLMAIAALIFSIIIASLGLKKLRDNGNNGIWEYNKTNLNFRLQTLSTYLAVILFLIVFFIKSGPSPQEKELLKINESLKELIKLDSIQLSKNNLHCKN